jgi:hypothetical protein
MNKWQGNLDNKLWTRDCLGFIFEIIKAIVKKKRTLTFYTLHTLFCMTKKDLIGGWVGVGQVTAWCGVLIMLVLLLKRLRCQILRTWN